MRFVKLLRCGTLVVHTTRCFPQKLNLLILHHRRNFCKNVNYKNKILHHTITMATSEFDSLPSEVKEANVSEIETDTTPDDKQNEETSIPVASCSGTQKNEQSNSESADDDGKPTLSRRALKRIKRFEKLKAMKQIKKKSNKRKNEDPNSCNSERVLEEAEYYFQNGLRKVYPYYFTFINYAKGHWIGREIYSVLCEEFLGGSPETFGKAILHGDVKINGRPVLKDYRLMMGDLVEHKVHRHENPVTADKIDIIGETEDMLVINKPSSIPCHPCGGYRFNSLPFILAKDYGYKNLRSCHRLDRLTSGIVIFGKTELKAAELHKLMLNKSLQKEYVCRVYGEFPEGPITCDQPLGVLSHSVSLMHVTSSGKNASTTFTRLSYNGQTSVVKCVLHTGRTHQIRVHLQYLGYPIWNDPLYNSDAFGPNKGKGGLIDITAAEVVDVLVKDHNIGAWKIGENPDYVKKLQETQSLPKESTLKDNNESVECQLKTDKHLQDSDNLCQQYSLSKADSPLSKRLKLTCDGCEDAYDKMTTEHSDDKIVTSSSQQERNTFDKSKAIIDLDCDKCKWIFKDPDDGLTLHLHALTYKGPDWEFTTPLPEWAREDWKPPS